jgi:hypothetical protein
MNELNLIMNIIIIILFLSKIFQLVEYYSETIFGAKDFLNFFNDNDNQRIKYNLFSFQCHSFCNQHVVILLN